MKCFRTKCGINFPKLKINIDGYELFMFIDNKMTKWVLQKIINLEVCFLNVSLDPIANYYYQMGQLNK